VNSSSWVITAGVSLSARSVTTPVRSTRLTVSSQIWKPPHFLIRGSRWYDATTSTNDWVTEGYSSERVGVADRSSQDAVTMHMEWSAPTPSPALERIPHIEPHFVAS
jgi:hypothetical protein